MIADLGMLESIEDLKRVKKLAEDVEHEREALAVQLEAKTNQNENVLDEFDQVNKRLSEAAQNIIATRSAADIATLRAKYGPLAVLDEIEALIVQREAKTAEKSALDRVQKTLGAMDAVPESGATDAQLELWNEELRAAEHQLSSQNLEPVCQRFNELLRQSAQPLIEALKSELLESNWDLPQKGHSQLPVVHLRELSSRIYRLNSMLLPRLDLNEVWNFQCIANNFKIKFVYHFVNDSMQKPHSVEMYFKFLEQYLDQNLFKCIGIFNDPTTTGLSQNFVHQQFINHILTPIREKVNNTLTKIANSASTANLNTLLLLLSQIFIIDNALLKKYFYDGLGLIAMIPARVLDTWLSFEIESSAAQFHKIAKSANLEKSGIDFSKLLKNLYAYFEPFFNVEYGKLMDYRLKITKAIFMELPNRYRDSLLKAKEETTVTDEGQFEQTLWKLQNLLVVRRLLEDFGNRLNFVELTDYLNSATSSSYETVFSEVINVYEEAIIIVRDSAIHRFKKMMNIALRNYFKVNDWAQMDTKPQQCSAELVSPLGLSSKVMNTIEKFELTPDIMLTIRDEILNALIHYMIDYVVNLNKFSESGLEQLALDFTLLKKSLNFPYSNTPQNAEEAVFLETFTVLKLKYKTKENNGLPPLISKKNIDSRDFSEIRKILRINYSTDSELANALYRLL
ncbi:LANO_0G08878g1_1 [Lachancea nothofagi CBS 11611]|uniref:LANO_0G08878g1_1 n=1 Tax=Lachancea nothofagi CBS 11611 TaxID=1266666 RepID=A0A1G4KIA9_9SACH|nr:LANO_0G08878g1_1 [Lachancea nothofagi CBS 11611]